jgi:hypothetical protein
MGSARSTRSTKVAAAEVHAPAAAGDQEGREVQGRRSWLAASQSASWMLKSAGPAKDRAPRPLPVPMPKSQTRIALSSRRHGAAGGAAGHPTARPCGPSVPHLSTSANLQALDCWPPLPVGTGPGRAPTRSPRRSPGLSRQPARSPGRAQGSGLSSSLIHPRPQPFADGRPERVRAGHGRWRLPTDDGQPCWKACWETLRSSNLLSSATLTCKNRLTCKTLFIAADHQAFRVSAGLICGLSSARWQAPSAA